MCFTSLGLLAMQIGASFMSYLPMRGLMSSIPSGPSSQRIYNQNTVKHTNFNRIRRKNALQSVLMTKPTINCTIDKECNTLLCKVLLQRLAQHGLG